MNRRRLLLAAAGLVVAVILAFFLQDVIRRIVITPLAYLWWVLNLFYAAIPQLLLWIVLLAGLVLIASISLLNWYSGSRRYVEPPKPALGPVESLSGWISKTGEGNYYKWMIANRLAKLKREMDIRLGNRGRVPPQELQTYLQAGLEKSFVDFPLPALPFMRRQPTPFDLDVNEAVEYLETVLKDRLE